MVETERGVEAKKRMKRKKKKNCMDIVKEEKQRGKEIKIRGGREGRRKGREDR